MASKSVNEAHIRLEAALARLSASAQAPLKSLERELLEAKAENLKLKKEVEELRSSSASEKMAVEMAQVNIRQVHTRLDEMAAEIVELLKQAGAR